MFHGRGDRDLGVAFQTHPGSQASARGLNLFLTSTVYTVSNHGDWAFPGSDCLVALVAQLLHCGQFFLGAGGPGLCPHVSFSSVAIGDCAEHARWADLSTHSGSSPVGCGSSALQPCWVGPSPWGWEHLLWGRNLLKLTHLEQLLWLTYF